MIVHISRHARGFNGALGAQIGPYSIWESSAVPQRGEIVTVHPAHEPSEDSWSGRVTGVQFVYGAGRAAHAHITVLDESERASALANPACVECGNDRHGYTGCRTKRGLLCRYCAGTAE